MKLFYKSFYDNYAQGDDQAADVYVFMRNLKISVDFVVLHLFIKIRICINIV